ncbi:MAG: hypothetical protein FD173_937 [Gallionellaceae bacterium]|nr:MAG: hypothetical protein FD173_937 [Gallionellaceae bacterium]
MSEKSAAIAALEAEQIAAAAAALAASQVASEANAKSEAAVKIPHQTVLKYPLTNGKGEKVTTITLRRGKLKDLKMAQRNSEGVSEDVDGWLVVILAKEELVFEDVECLDLSDWGDVQACLRGLT